MFTQSITSFLLLAMAAGCSSSRDASLPAAEIERAMLSTQYELPPLLSQTGLYSSGDPGVPRFGVIPYEVKVSLWTDGAKKKRFVFIPPDRQIGGGLDSFEFPEGTVFTKHFSTPTDEPIETRVIVRKADKKWYFGTYVWEGDDAKLVTNPTTVTGADGQPYRIPSQKECVLCHDVNTSEHPVIGFDGNQLNFIDKNGLNEISNLAKQALFSEPAEILEKATAIPDPANQGLPLETRARAYLAINCAPCHRPNGTAKEKNFDLRFGTPTDQTNLIANKAVVPGKPDDSTLWQKYTAAAERMPPLSIRADPLGLEILKKWIEQWPQ